MEGVADPLDDAELTDVAARVAGRDIFETLVAPLRRIHRRRGRDRKPHTAPAHLSFKDVGRTAGRAAASSGRDADQRKRSVSKSTTSLRLVSRALHISLAVAMS